MALRHACSGFARVTRSSITGARECTSFASPSAIAASQKINNYFQYESEAHNAAERIGNFMGPIADAIAESSKQNDNKMKTTSAGSLFVPNVPHVLPVTRIIRDNQFIREVLIYDDSAPQVKPRLSWYHPDDTMVPRGWFSEGLVADYTYYFGAPK
eukprot:gene12615-14911_t